MVSLGPADALEVLLSLPCTDGPGLAVGDSPRFLAEILAGRLVRHARRRPRSAVEAWLIALTGGDPAAPWDERELAALAEQLEQWRQAIERYAAHRTFRTCFRLSAPGEPAGPLQEGSAGANAGLATEPWRVEILLQAKDDPSVLVPAREVWSSNGDGLRVLSRQIEDPQERLLGGLGHALSLWPELEPALQESAPTGVELDASVVGNWQREAERFAPSLRVLVHHGPERLQDRAFHAAAARADFVITNLRAGDARSRDDRRRHVGAGRAR